VNIFLKMEFLHSQSGNPTVSRNLARIRISITARLTDKQIAKSLYVLENAKSKFHLI